MPIDGTTFGSIAIDGKTYQPGENVAL